MDRSLQESFNDLFQYAKEVWESIRNICNQVIQVREEIEEQNELRKTWLVPKDTTRRHQVLCNKPIFSRIRNQI